MNSIIELPTAEHDGKLYSSVLCTGPGEFYCNCLKNTVLIRAGTLAPEADQCQRIGQADIETNIAKLGNRPDEGPQLFNPNQWLGVETTVDASGEMAANGPVMNYGEAYAGHVAAQSQSSMEIAEMEGTSLLRKESLSDAMQELDDV